MQLRQPDLPISWAHVLRDAQSVAPPLLANGHRTDGARRSAHNQGARSRSRSSAYAQSRTSLHAQAPPRTASLTDTRRATSRPAGDQVRRASHATPAALCLYLIIVECDAQVVRDSAHKNVQGSRDIARTAVLKAELAQERKVGEGRCQPPSRHLRPTVSPRCRHRVRRFMPRQNHRTSAVQWGSRAARGTSKHSAMASHERRTQRHGVYPIRRLAPWAWSDERADWNHQTSAAFTAAQTVVCPREGHGGTATLHNTCAADRGDHVGFVRASCNAYPHTVSGSVRCVCCAR